jgi:hypothetical protein
MVNCYIVVGMEEISKWVWQGQIIKIILGYTRSEYRCIMAIKTITTGEGIKNPHHPYRGKGMVRLIWDSDTVFCSRKTRILYVQSHSRRGKINIGFPMWDSQPVFCQRKTKNDHVLSVIYQQSQIMSRGFSKLFQNIICMFITTLMRFYHFCTYNCYL